LTFGLPILDLLIKKLVSK
jgi:superfamily II DNA/RNA helicase